MRENMISVLARRYLPMAGFAAFLTLNTLTIWPASFPSYLGVQETATLWIYQVEITVSFCGCLFIAGLIGLHNAALLAANLRWVTILAGIMLFVGIANPLLLHTFGLRIPFLVLSSGFLLGSSSAALYIGWQHVFATRSLLVSAPILFSATMLSAVSSLSMLFSPDWLKPIVALCLLIPLAIGTLLSSLKNDDGRYSGLGYSFNTGVKEIATDAGDKQRVAKPSALYKFYHSNLSSQFVCMLALAAVDGIARMVSLNDTTSITLANAFSIGGLFVSAAIVLALWQFNRAVLAVSCWYQWVFPIMATGFLLLPFAGHVYETFFIGITFTAFSLVSMLMMLTCAQFAQERDLSPAACYGLLAGGFYLAHSLGFYINSLSFNVFSTGQTRISVLSMLAVYLLAMILFVVLRRANAQNDTAITLSGELLADANGETGSIDIASTDSETPSHFSTGINIAEMTRFYQLSPREGEILELLLNGRSVPYIANSLFLSQNTVRGHTKSLYRKLNVHSKQELIDCALASPQKLS